MAAVEKQTAQGASGLLHCSCWSAGFLPAPVSCRQRRSHKGQSQQAPGTVRRRHLWAIRSPVGSSGPPGQGLSLMGLCECQGTRAVNPPERHHSEGPTPLIGEPVYINDRLWPINENLCDHLTCWVIPAEMEKVIISYAFRKAWLGLISLMICRLQAASCFSQTVLVILR